MAVQKSTPPTAKDMKKILGTLLAKGVMRILIRNQDGELCEEV